METEPNAASRELGKRPSTRIALRAAVYRAIRHLEEHIDEPPDISALARAAGLSHYHFQRAFRKVVGETVKQHSLRLRVERAASLLKFSSWQVGEIALLCGFKTQASFGREFKRMFGATPGQFRVAEGVVPFLRGFARSHPEEELSDPEIPLPTVHLQDWPDLQAICVRHYGKVESVHRAWLEMLDWGRASLPDFEHARFMGLWFDDWSGVHGNQYRYECAMIPPGPVEAPPEPFFIRKLPAGTVAVSVAHGTLKHLNEAWQRFATDWLPLSGFQPRTEYVMDEYESGFATSPRAKQLLALSTGITLTMCLPVQNEPLRL